MAVLKAQHDKAKLVELQKEEEQAKAEIAKAEKEKQAADKHLQDVLKKEEDQKKIMNTKVGGGKAAIKKP